MTEPALKTLYSAIQNNTELGHIAWHKNQVLYGSLKEIETQLINNNKNYQYHPNDYIHALLSMHAYVNSKERDFVNLMDPTLDKYLKNWQVVKVCDDTKNSGYYGVICQNDKTHQIVLANRGTKGGVKEVISDLMKKFSDWKTNFEEIVGGQIVVGSTSAKL